MTTYKSRPKAAQESAKTTASVPRWSGCPCGCLTVPLFYDDPDCARHDPPSIESARDAWRHLNAHGLLDGDGFVEAVLARAA